MLLGKVQLLRLAPHGCRARSGCAADALSSTAVATGYRGVGSKLGE